MRWRKYPATQKIRSYATVPLYQHRISSLTFNLALNGGWFWRSRHRRFNYCVTIWSALMGWNNYKKINHHLSILRSLKRLIIKFELAWTIEKSRTASYDRTSYEKIENSMWFVVVCLITKPNRMSIGLFVLQTNLKDFLPSPHNREHRVNVFFTHFARAFHRCKPKSRFYFASIPIL